MGKEKRYFEWIDGEDKGKVVTLDYIDTEKDSLGRNIETYYFDNGDSCPKEFISPMTMFAGELKKRNPDGTPGTPKFMVELDSPTNVWTFEEVRGHTVNLGVSNGGGDGKRFVAPLEDIVADGSGRAPRTFSVVPPKNNIVRERPLPKASDYPAPVEEVVSHSETCTETTVQPIVEPVDTTVQSKNEHIINRELESMRFEPQYVIEGNNNVSCSKSDDDPVAILVRTSKKVEKEIDMKISLMLPSKELYSIATNNFEQGETKFINNIVRDIDVSSIIEALRDTLCESYRKSVKSVSGVE